MRKNSPAAAGEDRKSLPSGYTVARDIVQRLMRQRAGYVGRGLVSESVARRIWAFAILSNGSDSLIKRSVTMQLATTE